jgi:hypothetical protein
MAHEQLTDKKTTSTGRLWRREPSWLVGSNWYFQDYPVFISGIVTILLEREEIVKASWEKSRLEAIAASSPCCHRASDELYYV